MKPGNLYLIPTTLGHLKADGLDGAVGLAEWSLPPQVRSTATALSCFAAENAKSARAFLKLIGVGRPLQEIDIVEIGHHPRDDALKPLVDKLLGGIDVGVLAEAGCPGVADPGAQLARLAHAAGVRVVPLTGPSSLLLALMASGLDGQRFAFAGYAPVKSPMREEFIKKLESRSVREQETQILIETPYRNTALWQALLATLSERTRLTRAMALTLANESILTRTVKDWRNAPVPGEALDKQPAVFLFLAG
jgi:16S rRNA (cytidine1402-2'-O)-methyltransferase